MGGIDTSTFSGLFTMLNFNNTLANSSTALTARRFGPNSLLMGFFYGSPTEGVAPTFSAAPYAMLMPRRSNSLGSDIVPDQQAGISNSAQFIRDHLAPLRNAKPLALTACERDGRTPVSSWRRANEVRRAGTGRPNAPLADET